MNQHRKNCNHQMRRLMSAHIAQHTTAPVCSCITAPGQAWSHRDMVLSHQASSLQGIAIRHAQQPQARPDVLRVCWVHVYKVAPAPAAQNVEKQPPEAALFVPTRCRGVPAVAAAGFAVFAAAWLAAVGAVLPTVMAGTCTTRQTAHSSNCSRDQHGTYTSPRVARWCVVLRTANRRGKEVKINTPQCETLVSGSA